MRVCFGTLCFSSRLNTAGADDEDAQQVVVATDRGGGGPVLLNGGPESHGGGGGEGGRFIKMDTDGMEGGGHEGLFRLLAEKDEEIKRLQTELAQSHRKIFELRSQLDKFQSVMAITHSHPASPKGLGSKLKPRKQRAGISAEPQNEKSILEMSSTTFPTIYKDERLLAEKDEEIKRLQTELAQSHRKIFELRSQLDKFQSVMAITHSHPASPKGLGQENQENRASFHFSNFTT